jgi:ABC-type multidrug transport system fused ATPase/permease subunit
MIIIILNIASYTVFQFEDYYNNIQRIDIKEIVRTNIVNNLEKEFINNPKEIVTGEKLTNLLKTQDLVVSWYSNLKEYVIPYLFTFITTCWYFFTIDASLLIGMIFLLFSIVVVIFSCVLFCNQYHTKTNNDYVKIYSATEDYLSNMMTIFTHNQIENETSKIKELDAIYNKSYMKSINCILSYGLMGVVLMTVCLVFILYKSYELLKTKKIDTNTFVGLYFVTVGLLEKLIWMSNIFHNMSTNYSNLNNLVCNYDDEQKKNLKRMTPEKFKSIYEKTNKQSNIIEIRNLSFKYKDTKNYIFQNLNMAVKDGERVALVGEIGKG